MPGFFDQLSPSAASASATSLPQAGNSQDAFIQYLMKLASQNQGVQKERAMDNRNTGGRHLDTAGHDITNDQGPWGGPMTWTPPAERQGMQTSMPTGDFSLLTPAGRAPTLPPSTPIQGDLNSRVQARDDLGVNVTGGMQNTTGGMTPYGPALAKRQPPRYSPPPPGVFM